MNFNGLSSHLRVGTYVNTINCVGRTSKGSGEMEKVLARILREINNGKSVDAAWDAVLGAGEFKNFVADLHDKLTEKK